MFGKHYTQSKLIILFYPGSLQTVWKTDLPKSSRNLIRFSTIYCWRAESFRIIGARGEIIFLILKIQSSFHTVCLAPGLGMILNFHNASALLLASAKQNNRAGLKTRGKIKKWISYPWAKKNAYTDLLHQLRSADKGACQSKLKSTYTAL